MDTCAHFPCENLGSSREAKKGQAYDGFQSLWCHKLECIIIVRKNLNFLFRNPLFKILDSSCLGQGTP